MADGSQVRAALAVAIWRRTLRRLRSVRTAWRARRNRATGTHDEIWLGSDRRGWFSQNRHAYNSTTLHVLGISLVAVAAGMFACALLEALTTRRDTEALAVSGVIVGVGGTGLWYFTKAGFINKLQVFSTVAWTWIVMTLVGALPYVLGGTFASPGAGLSDQVVNAIFESVSGYSASGSTVMVDFDIGGRGLMMYRQATHWYGGMGVVVLAVAVLPFLGVGGLELISAEAPGTSSDRLTPRVSETARRLWMVYTGFTVAAVLALLAVGLSLYDAVAHALTLAATGGFSPYADSVGHFRSLAVEIVVIVFMLAGGTSFALHWRAIASRRFPHLRDSEFRSFIFVLALTASTIITLLWIDGELPMASAIRSAIFYTVSLGTSTGLGNATGPGSVGDYIIWAAGVQLVLLFLMVIGGCTGSTAGGIKVMRMQVLGIVMLRSVRHTQSPRAVIPVRLGRDVIAESVVSRVNGFFLLHVLLVILGVLVVSALGGDFETTLGSVVSALGNMGPALGEAGPASNFSESFSQPARLVLALLMIVGRLEIVPMLLAFVPLVERSRAATRALRR